MRSYYVSAAACLWAFVSMGCEVKSATHSAVVPDRDQETVTRTLRESEIRWRMTDTGARTARLTAEQVDTCFQEMTIPQVHVEQTNRVLSERAAGATLLGYVVGAPAVAAGAWGLATPCTFVEGRGCPEKEEAQVRLASGIIAGLGVAMLTGAVVNSIRAMDSSERQPAMPKVVRAERGQACGERAVSGLEFALVMPSHDWAIEGVTEDDGSFEVDLGALGEAHPMAERLEVQVAGVPVHTIDVSVFAVVKAARDRHEAKLAAEKAAEDEQARLAMAQRQRENQQRAAERKRVEDEEARAWPKAACAEVRAMALDYYDANALGPDIHPLSLLTVEGFGAMLGAAKVRANFPVAVLAERQFVRQLQGEPGTCRVQPELLTNLRKVTALMDKRRQNDARVKEGERLRQVEACVESCMTKHLSAREENCRRACR